MIVTMTETLMPLNGWAENTEALGIVFPEEEWPFPNASAKQRISLA